MAKIPQSFRFSAETIRRLELIAEKEKRCITSAIEFMVSEKADYYGIKILKKKETPSGAFPYNGFNNNKN